MRSDTFRNTLLLRLAGCLFFDLAAVFLFLQFFLLSVWISPLKAVLSTVVLIVSLLIVNASFIVPGLVIKRANFAHTVSLIAVALIYAVIANLVSILAIAGSTIWYVLLQLALAAAMLGIMAVLGLFSNQTAKDAQRDEIEREARQSIQIQLTNVEAALHARRNDSDISALVKRFKELKERIHASTPFGRMSGNIEAMEIEQAVSSNLEFIYLQAKLDMTTEVRQEIENLIEDTRRLVMNREILNIK